jgi:hypothetical protein
MEAFTRLQQMMRDYEMGKILTVRKFECPISRWRAFRQLYDVLGCPLLCPRPWSIPLQLNRVELSSRATRSTSRAFFSPCSLFHANKSRGSGDAAFGVMRLPAKKWKCRFLSQRLSWIYAVSEVFEVKLVCRCLCHPAFILPPSAVINHS